MYPLHQLLFYFYLFIIIIFLFITMFPRLLLLYNILLYKRRSDVFLRLTS